MTIIDRNHELANVPLREIQGVRIRNRQGGVLWRDFSSWKIAKFPLSGLGRVWTEFNEFAVLAPQSKPANTTHTASASADSAATPNSTTTPQ